MKNPQIVLAMSLLMYSYLAEGQKADGNLSVNQALQELPRPEKPVHKVLVLGTPHFDLGNNSSDWKPKAELDMMSSTKLHEIEEVVDLIKKIKPTKICIEWLPERDSLFTRRYQDYLSGAWQLKVGEYFQIGFRLAKMMGHEKLYCIDNRPKQPESLLEIDDWDGYQINETENSDLDT